MLESGTLHRLSEAISVPGDTNGTVPLPDPAIPGLQAFLRWFLVFTKPSSEKIAQTNLERQGYRVYYPRLLQPVLYRGRWIERVVSLFPRYLFVQLDSARQSFGPIRSTVGVAHIVCFGRESATVRNEIVERLMTKEDPQSGLHRLASGRSFERGTAVRVIAGAFEGIEGIFEREAGEDRIVILLRVLGRDTVMRLPSQYVVPLRGSGGASK